MPCRRDGAVGDRISIVVTTRNRPALLRSALRSAHAQTWPDKEVIVVDEASTEQTSILLANEFPQTKVIRHDAPLGPSAARNAGIAAARGDWVCFCDDDDLMHPEHLAQLLAAALAAPSHCLVSGRSRNFAVVGGNVVLGPAIWTPPDRPDTETLTEFLEPSALRTITHATILWPRKLFESELWDEQLTFYEDFDLCSRAILGGRHVIGRETGMYYIRAHSGPRLTTGAHEQGLLSGARYRLKWSELLRAHPEHQGCAAALRNGLMDSLIGLSGMGAGRQLMPRLEAAFRAWGGRRFYLVPPPRHWLKRAVAQSVVDVGGLPALRRLLAMVDALKPSGDGFVSTLRPAMTDGDKQDAAFIRANQ